MAPDSPPDSTDPDLRDRVAELEATVQQQQQTIQQLLPSRRRVLQAGGLVAGGGVLGALTADRASGQASGQVGTSSDPVDVEAYDLAVQNQLSSSIDAGGNDLTNVGSVSTDLLQSNRIENPDDSDNIVITQSETLSAGAKAELLPSISKSELAGFLTVRFGNGAGLFLVESSSETTTEVSDPRGNFSTSEGTGSSVNVYYDSSNSRYEIENGFGFSDDVQIVFLS